MCYIKKAKNNNIVNRKGFTLIELIIAMGLLVLVVFIAYSFLTTSGNLFNKNSDKADAQSQARLIYQGMKTQLSTATEVEISSDLIVSPGESSALYYSDGKAFQKQVKDSPFVPAFGNLELDSLEVQFIPQSAKLLKMIIIANGDTILETEIYSPNIVSYILTPEDLVTGNAIIITP